VADHPADTCGLVRLEQVEQARNIKTYLNANVVEIEMNYSQAVTECVLLAQVSFGFSKSFFSGWD